MTKQILGLALHSTTSHRLVGWLGFNCTFSTNRLHRAINYFSQHALIINSISQASRFRYDEARTVTKWDSDIGVGTNFGVGGRRGEAWRAESGVMGFSGRGQPAPPHQLGVLWERCKLPQWGPGRSPGRRKVFLYSEPSDCLSQHLSTCCIQFAWLGIRFF